METTKTHIRVNTTKIIKQKLVTASRTYQHMLLHVHPLVHRFRKQQTRQTQDLEKNIKLSDHASLCEGSGWIKLE